MDDKKKQEIKELIASIDKALEKKGEGNNQAIVRSYLVVLTKIFKILSDLKTTPPTLHVRYPESLDIREPNWLREALQKMDHHDLVEPITRMVDKKPLQCRIDKTDKGVTFIGEAENDKADTDPDWRIYLFKSYKGVRMGYYLEGGDFTLRWAERKNYL